MIEKKKEKKKRHTQGKWEVKSRDVPARVNFQRHNTDTDRQIPSIQAEVAIEIERQRAHHNEKERQTDRQKTSKTTTILFFFY